MADRFYTPAGVARRPAADDGDDSDGNTPFYTPAGSASTSGAQLAH